MKTNLAYLVAKQLGPQAMKELAHIQGYKRRLNWIYITLLILSISFMTACGSSSGSGGGTGGGSSPAGPACSDSANGQWQILPGPTDILTLNTNCSGYMSRCAQNFTYTKPTGSPGYTTITITDMPNGGANCLAAGTYACGVNYNSTNMAIDCGSGIVSYTKVP